MSMIDDIREQARKDAAILHDYALVNGGDKEGMQDVRVCVYGRHFQPSARVLVLRTLPIGEARRLRR